MQCAEYKQFMDFKQFVEITRTKYSCLRERCSIGLYVNEIILYLKIKMKAKTNVKQLSDRADVRCKNKPAAANNLDIATAGLSNT